MVESNIVTNELKEENDIFFCSEDGSTFNISFDQLFSYEQLKAYNVFDLSSKRTFKNISSIIVDTYNDIFMEEGKFRDNLSIILLNMLNIKRKVSTILPISLNDFLAMLNAVTGTAERLLIKEIDNFVEENYCLELDKATEEMIAAKKNVNEELIFSDEHAKTILKISYLYRILIPIISEYFYYNKNYFNKKATEIENAYEEEEEDKEELLFDEVNSIIFSYLFEKFAKNADSLRNKLYKMAYSRIMPTKQTAKTYWAAAEQLGITIETVTIDIYNKLLTNTIPKLIIDPNLNIINFFHAVLKNQVMFLFCNKFKVHYRILDVSYNDKYTEDNEMTEYERLEIEQSKKDEGSLIIQNISIKNTVNKLPEYLDVDVSEKEIQSMYGYIKYNIVQERIVSMLTFKYFKNTSSIKRLNAYEYAKVLVCCKKFLEKHKLYLLSQIIVSKCEKHRERVAITGTKIRVKIESSKKYQELFAKKYKNFKEEVEKPLSSLISTVYSSTFKDDEGNEIFDTSVKVGNIADELVEVAYLV